MASIVGALHRNWQIFISRPTPPKSPDALRFGILGASKIAPVVLVWSAQTHPEVIVSAVAARSKEKATKFAKQNKIPRVLDTYEDLVADPDIDVVYIPLPNGLHFEWALKCLAAGKHVLLEKPSVSNAEEANILFTSPGPGLTGKEICLEATHYRFQPGWKMFLDLIDKPEVEWARARMAAPAAAFSADDIRFQYDLAGGALQDMGAYTLTAVMEVFGVEAEECLEMKMETCDPPNEKVDYKFEGSFRFPNGGTGHIWGNLRSPMRELLRNMPMCVVRHRKKLVSDAALPVSQEKWVTREVYFFNHVSGAPYHSITVEDEFEVRKKGTEETVKKWTEKEVKKAYTWKQAGKDFPGEQHWLSYRWMLEEFVNKVKGRKGSGMWVSGEDSIKQMRMIDMSNEKAGLPLKRTSEFRLDGMRK